MLIVPEISLYITGDEIFITEYRDAFNFHYLSLELGCHFENLQIMI